MLLQTEKVLAVCVKRMWWFVCPGLRLGICSSSFSCTLLPRGSWKYGLKSCLSKVVLFHWRHQPRLAKPIDFMAKKEFLHHSKILIPSGASASPNPEFCFPLLGVEGSCLSWNPAGPCSSEEERRCRPLIHFPSQQQ